MSEMKKPDLRFGSAHYIGKKTVKKMEAQR